MSTVSATSCDFAASAHRTIGLGGANNPPVKLYFYHDDHLGTPRVITDVSGNLVSRHKYLPFGEELSPPPTTNSHKFTGHERDTETGLDYMLARYFGNVSTLRFLSVDPGEDTALELPQSHNKYVYVRNNPIGSSDPDGKISMIEPSKAQYAKSAEIRQDIKGSIQSIPVVGEALGSLVDAALSMILPKNSEELQSNTEAGVIALAAPMEAGENLFERAAGAAAEAGVDATKAASGAPISMDTAVSQAADHVGGTGVMESTGKGTNFQFRNTTVNEAGQTETKIGRLDVNPADPKVQKQGAHLNTETQVNGKQVQNKHTPIDPKTVRKGDHP